MPAEAGAFFSYSMILISEIGLVIEVVDLPDSDSRSIVGRWSLLDLSKNVGDGALSGTLRSNDQNFQGIVHFFLLNF